MADTTPPDLAALSFTPTTVDTSAGPQTVTVTVQLVDTDSGVAQGQLRFRSPSGNQFADTWWDPNHRIAGDEFKGDYENTVTLPQFSEQGTWSIEYVYLRDQVTNTAYLLTGQLQTLGFPTTLTQQGQGDATPPDLVKLQFKPTAINTYKAPQTIKVAARVQDKPAGVHNTQIRFRSPSGGQYADVSFFAQHLDSGDEYDGVYVDTITFPQFSEYGTWSIEYALLADRATNYSWLQTPDLQAKGFGVTLDQKGKGDVKPPDLLGLTFTPTTVNAAPGPQSVTVRAHVADKPAGVQGAEIRFRSPSGGQYADAWYFSPQHLVAGDEFDGEYENVMTLPQHAESGLWTIEYASVRDAVTNTNYLSTGQLQGAGFPVALTVL